MKQATIPSLRINGIYTDRHYLLNPCPKGWIRKNVNWNSPAVMGLIFNNSVVAPARLSTAAVDEIG